MVTSLHVTAPFVPVTARVRMRTSPQMQIYCHGIQSPHDHGSVATEVSVKVADTVKSASGSRRVGYVDMGCLSPTLPVGSLLTLVYD
eukprot:4965160-Pyramimonas_sp.AAC.1